MTPQEVKQLIEAAETAKKIYLHIEHFKGTAASLRKLAQAAVDGGARNVHINIRYDVSDDFGSRVNDIAIHPYGHEYSLLFGFASILDDCQADEESELKLLPVPVICQPTPDDEGA